MLAIYGKDLIKVARNTDLDPEFTSTLDPEGWNIVIMHYLHNDAEIRAEVLFKVKEDSEPVESTVSVTLKDWNKIVRPVNDILAN